MPVQMQVRGTSKEILFWSRPRPSVLVVAANGGPCRLDWPRRCSRHGCDVRALCPAGHPLTHVSGIRHTYNYGGIFSLSSLRRALRDCRPDVVIPCDDGVVAQLHALHDTDPSFRTSSSAPWGRPRTYSVVESRHRFLGAALELGIRVPRTRLIKKAGRSRCMARELVTASRAQGGRRIRR